MQFDFNNHFSAAGVTNPGQLRENNEDSFLIDAQAGLLVVADGMGGHQSGELASADAIRVMREILLENPTQSDVTQPASDAGLSHLNGHALDHVPDSLVPVDEPGSEASSTSGQIRVEAAIARANHAINNLNQQRGYSPREAMGTTIVGLYMQPERPMDATIFHVGDSRLYLYRDRKLIQITRDHSAYESWLDNGSNGPAPGHHVLSQAIGPSDTVAPAIQERTFHPEDVILLCSDGLTNLVSDDHIETILESMDTGDLADGCHRLVDAAQSNGGTDNITVVLGLYSTG